MRYTKMTERVYNVLNDLAIVDVHENILNAGILNYAPRVYPANNSSESLNKQRSLF